MSSNIKVQRICQLCGVQFTAKKTTTKYCTRQPLNVNWHKIPRV